MKPGAGLAYLPLADHLGHMWVPCSIDWYSAAAVAGRAAVCLHGRLTA